MINEKISLIEHFPMLKTSDAIIEPYITSYVPSNSPEISMDRKRPTIIVCPGGGYGFTSDREAEPVALNFMGNDYNAFVLRYNVAPARFPQALLELAATVAFLRRNADKYNVDTNAIVVCGFSAGGHLAASLGVFWDKDFIKDKLNIESWEAKPNAMILAYPVITSGPKGHFDSFLNLLGEKSKDQEMLDLLSIEKQVSENTPPAFIWHTFSDGLVPVENSLLLADALTKYKIPYELHIYPDGPHGLSLCDKVTSKDEHAINKHVKSWIPLCKEWLELNF